MKKPSDRLGVKIVGGLKETSTPWAGASLLVDLFRRLEMGEAADRVLPAKGPLAGLEASAVAPVAESVVAPEPEAANDPAVDDLLDLFTESAPVNEELRRLSLGLEEVNIRELAGECQDVVAQLKRRKQRMRTG